MASEVHETKQPASLTDGHGLIDRRDDDRSVCLPIFLNVAGRDCLVVGGGKVAERKVITLLECRAAITVVSPRTTPGLDALSPDQIRIIRHPYETSDLDGKFLAIAATDDSTLNARIVADARARGILVGSVGPKEAADFTFGATIRRPGLTLAVSTGGRSPAFGRWLRDEIESFLTPEYIELLAVAADVRADLRRIAASVSSDRWRASLTRELLDLLRQGRDEDARTRLREALISREE
jgi:precorrin-2 dehydrogenase/sirohydrochlorin ferrochelatase